LACGTGRILLPIAQSGVTITGVDLYESMLDVCREKLCSESKDVQSRVTLHKQNMLELELDKTFQTIIAPFRALQHLLDVSDQIACLERVRSHLAPGGQFIFDVFMVNLHGMADLSDGKEVTVMPTTTLPDGRQLAYSYRIAAMHPVKQYNDVELIYYLTDNGGATERFVDAFPWRYYFPSEMEHLLERSGFKIAKRYGRFDSTPLANDSEDMIFVTEHR